MTEDLAKRLKELILQSHQGSMNAAAKAIGLPQPTLAKLVTGRAANPRAKTLKLIAEYYDVGMDWLLTGRLTRAGGRQVREARLAFYRWERLCDALSLPPDIEDAWFQVPLNVIGAEDRIRNAIDLGQGTSPDLGATAARWLPALDASFRAWTELLDAHVREHGVTRVRDALIALADEARLGFAAFPIRLREEGLIAGDLAAAFSSVGGDLLEGLIDTAAPPPDAELRESRQPETVVDVYDRLKRQIGGTRALPPGAVNEYDAPKRRRPKSA